MKVMQIKTCPECGKESAVWQESYEGENDISYERPGRVDVYECKECGTEFEEFREVDPKTRKRLWLRPRVKVWPAAGGVYIK